MNLIDGSFRGFPFFLTTYDISGENFTKTHDFLNSPGNLIENNGRKSKKLSLNIIVKGDDPEDYHRVRDDFIKVLDQQGEGVLMHPYLGKINAVVESYLHEGGKGNGLAEFKVSFLEVKEKEEDGFDFRYEFQNAIRKFNTTFSAAVDERVNVKALTNEFYHKLEGGFVGTLQTIDEIKNALDPSIYIEKGEAILQLTTDKGYWNTISDFIDSYLTFKNYSDFKYYTDQIIHLYGKVMNFDREFFIGIELPQEKEYKKFYNLIHEATKYTAISKMAELAWEGLLGNEQIDYTLEKIRQSKHDPIIPGTYQVLGELEKFLSQSKKVYDQQLVPILSDFKTEFQNTIRTFDTAFSTAVKKIIEVKENIDVEAFGENLYQELKSKFREELEGIQGLIDPSTYAEKLEFINSLTTNKSWKTIGEEWNIISAFIDSYLTFNNYSDGIIRLYEKLIDSDWDFTGIESNDEEGEYKKTYDLIREAIKYTSLSKMVELAKEGLLNNDQIHFTVAKIKQIQGDLMIPGTYEYLAEMEKFLAQSMRSDEKNRMLSGFRSTFQNTIRNFNTAVADTVKDINLKTLGEEFYQELEDKFVETLQIIEDVLDPSIYIEKIHSLERFTTDKKWNTVSAFIDSYLTFNHYNDKIIGLYEKWMDLDRAIITEMESDAEKEYKRIYNLIHEVIRCTSLSKMAELAEEDLLSKTQIDDTVAKIKQIQDDFMIPGTNILLGGIKELLNQSMEVYDKYRMGAPLLLTPALVIAYDNQVPLEQIASPFDNINEIMEVSRVWN